MVALQSGRIASFVTFLTVGTFDDKYLAEKLLLRGDIHQTNRQLQVVPKSKRVFGLELWPPEGDKSDTNADFPEISENRRKNRSCDPDFFQPIDSADHF
jgi:hypothetical protein